MRKEGRSLIGRAAYDKQMSPSYDGGIYCSSSANEAFYEPGRAEELSSHRQPQEPTWKVLSPGIKGPNTHLHRCCKEQPKSAGAPHRAAYNLGRGGKVAVEAPSAFRIPAIVKSITKLLIEKESFPSPTQSEKQRGLADFLEERKAFHCRGESHQKGPSSYACH